MPSTWPPSTRWIQRFAELVAEHRDELTALDAAIGDADHGTNMDRGMTAVVGALGTAPPTGAGGPLKQVGMTLVRTVGGASGPLYGTFFLRMATALGEDAAGVPAEAFAKSAPRRPRGDRGARQGRDRRQDDVRRAGARGRCPRGRAGRGRRPGRGTRPPRRPPRTPGATRPIPLHARKGRASYLGERSVGHQDPGATSAALLVAAAAETLPPQVA